MLRYQGMYYERQELLRPQVNLSCSTPGRMWLVGICAFMVILQSAMSDAFYSLLLAAVVLVTALLTEIIALHLKGEKTGSLKDGSVVASALVFTLLLPNRISPLYAVPGIIFAVAVIKHCFGGLGSNWLNPAAGGWLFMRLSWPGAFSRALEGSSLSVLEEGVGAGLSAADGSLVNLINTNSAHFFSNNGFLETSVRPFLNNSVFSFLRIELPSSYLELFSSPHPGIIADRGIIALLIGAIIILAIRASRSWISAVWLGVFIFFTLLAGALPYGAGWWQGDVLFALSTGGTFAAAFLLAADPATGAKSTGSVIISAALGGFLAWLFRFPGGEAYGALISVMVINALLPVIRNIENYCLYEKRAS